MNILIITGPPYSGKGTQCEILEKQLHYKHISTGDLCRSEKEQQTEIGKTMSRYEEKGDLVPDTIMKELFSQTLDNNRSEKGIILDGYPRTKPQVDDLIELLNEKELTIETVLNIAVPSDELLKRAAERAKNSTRKDDKDPKIHTKRITVFQNETIPAIAYLESQTNVLTVDGMGSIEEITNRIKSSL